MGNCVSSDQASATAGSHVEYLDAENAYTSSEVDHLQQILCDGDTDPGHRMRRASLFPRLGLSHIDIDLQERLVLSLTRGNSSAELTFKQYLIGRAKLEKGGYDEVEDLCFTLLRSRDAEDDTRADLKSLSSILAACQKFCAQEEELTADSRAVVASMLASVPSEDGCVLRHHLHEFFARCPAAKALLRCLLCEATLLPRWSRPPTLHCATEPPDEPIMSTSWSWLIAAELTAEAGDEWHLLYASSAASGSLQRLLESTAQAGPTLLLVRDTAGRAFGCYAPDAWAPHGHFYGEHGYSSFVFTLSPAFALYRCTGDSDNFQWCCRGSEVLPNGIGIGGSQRSHALFVDDSLRVGHSCAAATYGSPSLAAGVDFEVAALECWSLRPHAARGSAAVRLTGSVLERHEKELAFLGLSGRQAYSHGMREDVPEEFKGMLRV